MAIPGSGIAKGMATTFRNFFAPKVTRQYPERAPDIPDRWRGRLDLIYDPFGEHKCEVCFQCAQVCPVEAIDMSGFDSQGNRIRYGMPEIYDERKDANAYRRAGLPARPMRNAGPLGRGDRHAVRRRGDRRASAGRPEALVAIFRAVEERYGYLPERALRRISDRMSDPLGAGLRRRRPRRLPPAAGRGPRRHRMRLRRVPVRRRRRSCWPRSSDELGIRAGEATAGRPLQPRDAHATSAPARSARRSASTPWSSGR